MQIDARGQVTHIATAGREPIVATRDHYWGIWHQHVWRLDPSRPTTWKDMGPGVDLAPMYSSDAVWVSESDRCAVLHDAQSFARLWDACDGTQAVQWPSPDGRYGVRTSADGSELDVVEARTGRIAMRVDASPDTVTLGGTASWLGGTSIWSGDVFWFTAGNEDKGIDPTGFACDVQRHECGSVDLPGPLWWGTPLAR